MATIDDFVQDIPFLSFQQRRMLKEQAQDLVLWGLDGKDHDIQSLWPAEYDKTSKNEVRKIYSQVMAHIDALRHTEVDYSTFHPTFDFKEKGANIVKDFLAPEKIMGKCPCPRDGEQTRCCNLKTLDAVQQCAFACAYCSIQSFYSSNEVRIVSDLKQHLENMVLEEGTWHIGTGQSSDSLLLGDDYGTLTALFSFARLHPEVVIELKTKCARTDWLSMDIPANIVSTWSLNAPTAAAKEEHLAATPHARIKAAAACAQKGNLVGFHIHPMVHFCGWQKEYAELVKFLCDSIDPKNAVMVGMGTLTFTKQNLRTLRESERPTRVTQMPLSPIAGKFSYDLQTKRQMFSHVYSCFPQDWKENVFFYLCMEDPSLWQPCLGRSYACNADFENDMKEHYLAKVRGKAN
ncbi:MAG: DNA photolyase [Sphaerochaetaceae bacterium]|nr:DNA photolyase [Sphaerochaetaceae bacterium]